MAASAGNRGTAAFLAPSANAVDAAYAAGMLSVGADEGNPRQCPRHGVGYYCAYMRDPDENKGRHFHRWDLPFAGSS